MKNRERMSSLSTENQQMTLDLYVIIPAILYRCSHSRRHPSSLCVPSEDCPFSLCPSAVFPLTERKTIRSSPCIIQIGKKVFISLCLELQPEYPSATTMQAASGKETHILAFSRNLYWERKVQMLKWEKTVYKEAQSHIRSVTASASSLLTNTHKQRAPK